MKRRNFSSKRKHHDLPGINFRALWYLALTWIFGFLISSIIVLPWFYVILPLVVLLLAVFYLDNPSYFVSKRNMRDEILKAGLALSIVWFLGILLFSFFMFAEFYYFDLSLFFADSRNWFLPAAVLIVPIVYSFFLAGARTSSRKRRGLKVAKSSVRGALN